MKRFDYADDMISEREIMIAMPSMVIGAGIIILPRNLAAETAGADGVVSLVIGGIIATFIAWLVAKLAAGFPHQTFISYASLIATKPVAIVLTFIFSLIAFLIAAIEVREIADVSKQYLFDRTPVEVIALTFLLVVVYAVSGSRAGLLRLNMMFLPIILFIATIVLVFNLKWFDMRHLQPMFQTSFKGYMHGVGTSVTSYIGFGILWFYMALVKQPKKAPKKAVIGMMIPIAFYIFLFVVCIAAFGNHMTSNLIYPTVELAKTTELPGEFFERFELVFFVIWIMAIFNTAAMGFDIAVFALTSIFKNIKKLTVVLILSPVIYLCAMYPQEPTGVSTLEKIISYSAVFYTIFVILFLTVIAKIRGVKRVG